jgi:hypothetical protein
MKKHAACAAALAALCLPQAHAGPAIYVHTPNVEYGEREIELIIGGQRGGGKEREDAARLVFGLGVTQRWFSEVGFEFARTSDSGSKLEAVEWENTFQLTESGEYPVDVGLLVEIERLQGRDEGYEFKLGPLFQTDLGRFQLNANLLFERHFDAKEKSETELGYEWQLKYRWKPSLDFGAMGFGEMGKWNDWEPSHEQQHLLGPAVFGKLPLGNHQALKYNAAYLLGVSDGAADHVVRMQLEYEF